MNWKLVTESIRMLLLLGCHKNGTFRVPVPLSVNTYIPSTLSHHSHPIGPPMERIRDVANSLRLIGDELDGDERLKK